MKSFSVLTKYKIFFDMFGKEEENTLRWQAESLILAEAIPLSLHEFILLINWKHITGKPRNFTVNGLFFLPQNNI